MENRKTASRQKIRFGVMCFSREFPLWQAQCIRQVMAMDGVELVLLIQEAEASNFHSFFQRVSRIKWNQFFFQVYNNFLAKPPASHLEDLSNELSTIPMIPCKVLRKGRFSQYFSEEDLETIRGYDLDFILRFAFGIIRGEILKVPRYGVWSFHNDDEEKYRGGPPCFWEIDHSDPVTGSILQRLTNRLDGGVILRKGYFPTELTSYKRNLHQAFMNCAEWPAQVVQDIRNGVTDYVEAPPSKTEAPIYYSPTNIQMLTYGYKLFRNTWRDLRRSLFEHDQWNVGLIRKPIHSFLDPEFQPKIEWFPPPQKGQFFADPFAIKKDETITVLFEELRYVTYKGRIFAYQFHDDPKQAELFPVMEEPFHLSYPYLFEYKGQVYCVPEKYHTQEIALYRAQTLPHKWNKVATLVENIQGVDATLFRYGDRWWLSCTDQRDGPCFKLRLWYAEDLLGPWKPHANNPVKVDIRGARPGGTPFWHDGRLYRPAQDCSAQYGSRVVINRIDKISPIEFHETPVAYVEADKTSPYPKGCHTVSALGEWTIVDGKRNKFIWDAFCQTLFRGAAKLKRRRKL